MLATVALAVLFVTGSVADAFAQTGYVPYFGKNRIRYDNFKWNIYTTDHFEIYYYPEIEQHIERVTSYAESAYQQVSSDLKHDLAFKVPLVLYKTQAEFQQQNIEPGELPEGVLAFAEPYRDRMVLPIDEPSDAALSPDHARAHAHLRVRHHSAVAAPPRPSALGRRRTVGLHDRLLEPVRPDDGPRRRHRRHRSVDERLRGRRSSPTAGSPTTSVTRRSSSSSRSGARKASGSSSSRCART